MNRLAIVIPAFKRDFFRSALESIDAQSDRRFSVYVGSDGGPEELGEICGDFPGLDLTYHRFPENLGSRSLTEHWNRCVAMSTEPWVWLFADDDKMGSNCVATFHEALPGLDDASSVVRFDTRVIDASGRTISENPAHPPVESGAAFLLSRLRGERNSFVVEYIFRRRAFERSGGFPNYPVAWCADDVAWYSFSATGHIRTLGGDRVSWRASGLNITDANRRHQREKLTAAGAFLSFVDTKVRTSDAGAVFGAEAWDDAAERWALAQLRYLLPMSPALLVEALRFVRGRWRCPLPVQLAKTLSWNATAGLRAGRSYLRRLLGS